MRRRVTASPDESQVECLFVYGTLAPGRSNAHQLADIPGTWAPARVRGVLHPQGWGAAAGYPALQPCRHAAPVSGLLFRSEALGAHWERLDVFEGEGYERVRIAVQPDDGEEVEAWVYAVRRPSAE